MGRQSETYFSKSVGCKLMLKREQSVHVVAGSRFFPSARSRTTYKICLGVGHYHAS
jgi:hypothetical protein